MKFGNCIAKHNLVLVISDLASLSITNVDRIQVRLSWILDHDEDTFRRI